ncbi:MAG: response regulator [Caulobacteraceae bacterium]
MLDLGLPDLDGKAVIEAIRAWSDVPILVLSARDIEQEKIAALDLGADDFVNKPFAVGEFLARLRATCAGASGASRPAPGSRRATWRSTSRPVWSPSRARTSD